MTVLERKDVEKSIELLVLGNLVRRNFPGDDL
jgi:hypothetical protein